MSGPRPAWGVSPCRENGRRRPAPRPDLPGEPLGNAAAGGGGVPGRRATELLGRSWLRSGGGRRGREAGGPAIVQAGRIFVRRLLVAIARREIQTEGLSSPPSGLRAAFPPLSQNKSAARGLAPLPRRADSGLEERGREDPGTERGAGASSPAGNSQAGYCWGGRRRLSLSPYTFPATFYLGKLLQHSQTRETFRWVKPPPGLDWWERLRAGSAVGGERPARGSDAVPGRSGDTGGRKSSSL